MRASLDNFLYFLKQIVTGLNGDSVEAAGQSGIGGTSPSADGGIKHDEYIGIGDVVPSAGFPLITDSTGGSDTGETFAAIAAGASYLQSDMTAVKNALAVIAKNLNALHNQFATTVSNVPAIAVAAGATTIGTISFSIPRDYDEASDHLAVRLAANSTNADASITITGTPTIQPIATGTATTGSAVTATAPFGTASLNVGTTTQIFEINLSGNGLKRDDIVAVALAFAGTTTGIDYVYSIERTYDSTIVSYNETDATDDVGNAFSIAGNLTGFGNPLR